MSHTTHIKSVAITDMAALSAAVEGLKAKGIKCDLVQDQKPRMYFGNQHGKCDYVLKLHDCPYDVGFDKQADGSYVPVFDEWAGNIKKQLGVNMKCDNANDRTLTHIGQLMQGYATEAATNAAIAQGYYVESSEIDAQGNVQLIVQGF